MKLFHARERRDCEALFKKHATDAHYTTVLRSPARVVAPDGRPLLWFLPLNDAAGRELLTAVETLKYDLDWRTDGMQSRCRTFGSMARVPLRRDFATKARSAQDFPREHALLERWAGAITDMFLELYPSQARLQIAQLREHIEPCWRMPGDLFTSGIVNKRFSLWYHRDAGNFKNTWNAQVTLARDLNGGGRLVLPEYDLALDFDGAELILFPASNTLHGVTPIKTKNVGSHRYSIVWYALEQLKHCGTPAQELDRIRKVKTERARKRTSANSAQLRADLEKMRRTK